MTLAAVALLSLTGCGGDDASVDSLSGPLEYERGGGIAGEAEKLIVRPDATGSFERRRGLDQEAKDVKLTASERDELAEAGRGRGLRDDPVRQGPSRCPTPTSTPSATAATR